ncbi:MAG TPA: alternate F1F0 ATPase, F1 subunit alpha [Candidatus Hydrogenedentes bacterium]|nr:alternate F1F0 ATPase, F1 subunit alpha [Candidatus Hydrogenedentota bacterium]
MTDIAIEQPSLKDTLKAASGELGRVLERQSPDLGVYEVGDVLRIGEGVATVRGLPGVQAEEVLRFTGNRLGLAFNLDPREIGVIMLDHEAGVEAGSPVRRTGRVMDVPVGEALLGRVVDPMGRPRDGGGPVRAAVRYPLEREAPGIMDRLPVTTPLQTGIKVVDALVPVGRGQRELILGDRQTGKTALAVAAILNQRQYGLKCVYCAIAQRSSAVAQVVAQLRQREAMEYTCVVATTGDDPAGLQYAAPYAATAIAEYFMHQGEDVLVVYDDLSGHAIAYRELSLLLRRPPGREAYPGDIFYIHSRLLERATHLDAAHGGGSLTALPIIETQAQNLSAFIPTNLISITDGQVYLSPRLFQQGIMPAVDVGRSVSRVGGKAQLPAYRSVAGDLKLSYSQFEELERFSRYGTRLEEEKQQMLERGRRVREILKQGQFDLMTPGEQIIVLLAVTEGLMDDVAVERVRDAAQTLRDEVKVKCAGILEAIEQGEKLSETFRSGLRQAITESIGGPAARDDASGDDRKPQ